MNCDLQVNSIITKTIPSFKAFTFQTFEEKTMIETSLKYAFF